MPLNNVVEIFGCMVFNDEVMRQRLPKDIYKALKKTIDMGVSLDAHTADVIATVMKDWAIEKGATHYTHWFQPMTGITAEKHDSFITPAPGGRVLLDFSGKELIKGEPDASSFPSGGLRATFEARGYTSWDPSSYTFIKDNTLYIPTVFCSYGGEALDKKTPLLRSMEAINKQTLRLLKLFGKNDVKRVITTVGAEQEYFLIDKDLYKQRKDLIFTGRTLFGAMPPKGQELEDHYFGTLKTRVSKFMHDLDEELWKLGIYAKTKHNEVAPAQHELAPIFTTTNIATDHNQLTMELMKRVAEKHNLVCLLHEKPFAGVNGSGKHNNWSLLTDTGINLLEPGDSPQDNALFITILCAIIKAVNENQDLLRITSASAGNDLRLGANEAPPTIISIFLGDELTKILESIEYNIPYNGIEKRPIEVGVDMLPKFFKDNTDRNRTSPFAFTGNKFEFRMLGSSFSIAGPNFVLNTIVAEVFSQFADVLENSNNFTKDLNSLLEKTIKENKQIIFNGNNYSEEWVNEAKRRGLLNLQSTVDALPKFIDEKNIKLFTKHNILNENEIRSRYEIILQNYSKTLNIEALTTLDMASLDILPSAIKYQNHLAQTISYKKSTGVNLSYKAEEKLLIRLSALSDSLYDEIENLKKMLKDIPKKDVLTIARYYRNEVFTHILKIREISDELETIIGKEYWPFPTYKELLFEI